MTKPGLTLALEYINSKIEFLDILKSELGDKDLAVARIVLVQLKERIDRAIGPK